MKKKIDLFYTDMKGKEHYLYSTKSYDTCRDALVKAKDHLTHKKNQMVNYAIIAGRKVGENIDVNRIKAHLDDGCLIIF